MRTKKDILAILKEIKISLKRQYKVREIWLFGSVLRGEQNENSDIDILVDFEDGADFFNLVGLGLFLEDKLGTKVDVVPKRSLREELKETVLAEAVAL